MPEIKKNVNIPEMANFIQTNTGKQLDTSSMSKEGNFSGNVPEMGGFTTTDTGRTVDINAMRTGIKADKIQRNILGYTPQKPTNVADLLGGGNVAPPNVNDVFSGQNTQQALTQPAQQPVQPTPQGQSTDPNSAMGIYDKYFSNPEISAAQQRVADLRNQQNQINQGLRTTTNALSNQNQQAMGGTGASINLIGGQVARARNLASAELSAIGENLSAEQSALDSIMQTAREKFNIEMQERDKIETLMAETKGKAGITQGMSYAEAIARTGEYYKNQEKEERKQNLKDIAIQNGIYKKGMSTKDLEKAINKNAKAKAQYEKSQQDYNRKVQDLEYKMKEAAYRKSYGASNNENIDVNSIISSYYGGGSNVLPKNTVTGDQTDALSSLGY